MKKYICLTILGLAAILLNGCASIVNGTHESVSVNTGSVKDATCKLYNSKGTWYVNKTPGSVTVHRAYGPLHVVCNKKGYATAKKTVKSHTKGMAFGNVVFGGVVGAGVDVADGAAYNYPNQIIMSMHKKSKKQA